METIKIKHCNNIVDADISILPGALNIKYGFNGTGKSTISKAIRFKTLGDDSELAFLKPYVTESENDKPYVGDIPFSKVKVFDEEYAHDYVFKTDDVFEDSFSVFLKTEECDSLSRQISSMLAELKSTLIADSTINDLLSLFLQYVSAVNYSDGRISKRGGIGEVIKGNGAGFEKHAELTGYSPFYSGKSITDVSNWANWRTKGIEHMNGNTCPFCADSYDVPSIQKQNDSIKTVFKNSSLKTASAIIEYLKTGIEKGYILIGTDDKLEEYFGESGKADEISSVLGKLAVETSYLTGKLQRIVDFAPMNVSREELSNIEEKLKGMEINISEVSEFYSTTAMSELVNDLNSRIGRLLLNTEALRKLFLEHEAKLVKLIHTRKEDINYFFTLAGFPYEFELRNYGENKAKSYLTPIGEEQSVTDPRKRLSWGERNAFSLVMFMFDAVSENADLIVLDDPISSFDINKKFAVIKRMFDSKQKVNFRNKTVLMLTHDLQPVIDYVHGSFFTNDNIQVYAEYIENEKGHIHEYPIEGTDLLNVVNLTRELAKKEEQTLHVRVINLRKYIELTNVRYSESNAYQILSNLVHGRVVPKFKDGEVMSEEAINSGIQEIKSYITAYDTYLDLISELTTEKLLAKIVDGDMYKRIIAIRFIFERGSKFLTQLRREHPGACKFLNETNHIENDYVFQLDPNKFFSMPEVYSNEIHDFLSKHISEINQIVEEENNEQIVNE